MDALVTGSEQTRLGAVGLNGSPLIDGVVHCLDARTGNPWWKHDSRPQVFGSPLVVDRTVYVGNDDGVFHVLALERDMRVIARHELESPMHASPVYANGVLYVATEFLFCLDAQSGETRWASRIGSVSDTNQVYMHGLMRWLSPRVPTVDDDRIYTISASGELSCLRTAGFYEARITPMIS